MAPKWPASLHLLAIKLGARERCGGARSPKGNAVESSGQKGVAIVEVGKSTSVRADCPDCGQKITLKGPVVLGQEVVCPHCEAELEVVETEPVELDWAYDDEWDDDEWDDEEEDEDW
jgi:alpha-aminoadipate carrier protein LysW